MEVKFIKASPTENMTLLIETPVAREKQLAVAERLIAYGSVYAEQAGYIEEAENPAAEKRLQMMAGEFCGNASRAAAAYALSCEGKDQGVYGVSCSGCDEILPVKVNHTGGQDYEAFIEMPYPDDVSGILVDVGGVPARFFRVDLPGITHFVHFVETFEGLDKDVYWQALKDYVDGEDFPAYGLILCNTKTQEMIPAVYVSRTDTLYWENSCGSGSAAVAAALACTTRKRVAAYMKQPGGTIAIAASVDDDGNLHQIFMGGSVKLGPRQSLE